MWFLNCCGENSHQFYVSHSELQQHNRRETGCFLSPLLSDRSHLLHPGSAFKMIQVQDYSDSHIAVEERDLFLPHSNHKPSPIFTIILVELIPIKYTACQLALKHQLKWVHFGLDLGHAAHWWEWNHKGGKQRSIFIFYLILRYKL